VYTGNNMIAIVLLGLSCSEYNIGDKVEGNDVPLDENIIEETQEEPSDETQEPPVFEQPPDDGFDSEESEVSEVPIGNVVTILMALSEQWIPTETAAQLIINAVNFTTEETQPNILVIRDDNTNGEDESDPMNITGWLQDAGYNVDFVEEPSEGITLESLNGYHVAILSNPGYPPDDDATIEVLYQFSLQGYGIIFQGDDMTRSTSPLMEELTRLHQIDNGTSYYDTQIDNNNGAAYSVRMIAASVLNNNIEMTQFIYGNDIDTTEVAFTEVNVAAWATVEGSDYPEKPVVTAFSPQQSIFQ
jgi:hypothetical protein